MNKTIYLDMVKQSLDCLANFIYNLENNLSENEIEDLKELYKKNKLNSVKTAGIYYKYYSK